MPRLQGAGMSIRREDRWPAKGDTGSLVILPGGEVGESRSASMNSGAVARSLY
ncbi:MAG TPA: hypothetical protein VNU19_02315 [Candidatus Acidoferrum sp.]|jgi:hypothetical protein|nr:hypothetical protein [Candidatus Acidoferrum sp.]